jgi:hypothetical protein
MSKPIAQAAPHSWPVAKWPLYVWPGDPVRGKRFCRTYVDELVAAGALVRMGRDLVVMGGPFTQYMLKQRDAVKDFEVPANRPQHAGKRGKTNGQRAGVDVS